MENRPPNPPPIITLNDSALLCYAVLDESVGYKVNHGLFFVDGKEIGKVPRLAICRDKDLGLFTLYYCDDNELPRGGCQLSVSRSREESSRAYLSWLIDTLARLKSRCRVTRLIVH